MDTTYKAAPTSKRNIEEYANQIRERCGFQNIKCFPIVHFLEIVLAQSFPDMSLLIVEPEDMPYKEAETVPGQSLIRIRQDVYNAATEGDGRARFTIAHEVGHFLMHTPDSIVLCRMEAGTDMKAYEDPEWQANTFASYLLAPSALASGLTKREIMQQFQMSEKAAKVVASRCKQV